MVDQNAPHGFRRGGEEVAAVVEVLVADETQVRLVDQGGGVQGVPGILRGHPRGSELPQLVVDQRQQLLGRLAVALLDGREDAGDVVHRLEPP